MRDVAFTLARRARFEYRAVVDAEGEDLVAALAALRDGTPHPGVVTGRALPDRRLAFLFSGQGAQRIGMATGLLATSAPYAAAFEEIAGRLAPHIGADPRELITGDAEVLRQTRYAQPALFAVQVALYRLAEAHGLRPDYLIGHSVGELAAAHVAGVLDADDACALVAARGRLMQSAPGNGAMAAFTATEAEAAELAEASGVEIAAVNGPASVVLSGDADEIDRLVARWRSGGRKATRLKVSHAFHSAQMDAVLDEFREVVSGLTFAEPRVPIISTATGELTHEITSPDYWVAQLRGTVRFADAVRTAHRSGVTSFVEIGPDGTLATMAQETAEDVQAVPLLRPRQPDQAAFRAALARLHVAGVPVDFAPFLTGGRLVDLPTYPFETRRYWLPPSPEDGGRPAAYGLDASPHPLLAAATDLPGDARMFTGVLSPRRQPWLAEHRVGGRGLVPAAALVELALAVGAGLGRPTLAEFVTHAPLELHASAEVRLQVSVAATGELTVRGSAAGAEWTVHATGLLTDTEVEPTGGPLPSGPGDRFDAGTPEATYRLLAEHGYEYGPAFQGLSTAWTTGSDLYAEAELPASLRTEAAGYALHPALLDAALHAVALHGLDGPRRVPYALHGVRLHAGHATRIRVRLRPVEQDAYRADLIGDDGQPVLTVERLRLRPLPSTAGLYRRRWEPVAPPEPAAATGFVLAGTLPERHPRTVLLDLRDETDDPYAPAEAALEAVQRWLAEAGDDRLVFLTRGLAVRDGEVSRPATAALWGLVRSARTEHPGRFALLDADDAAPELLAAIGAGLPEAAVRDGVPLVPRLVAVPPPDVPAGTAPGGEQAVVGASHAPDLSLWPRSAAGGTVLITGGTGALGREVARHLVTRHGVRNLLLVSRRGERHPGAAAAEAELTALGARVAVRACDLSDRAALAGLLAGLDAPLTGVVHAAGVVEDAVVERLSAATLRRTLDAKAVTAHHLDELTRDADLDAFVLFGSVAGVLGTAGQAAYGAANAALEAIGDRRRAAGGPALTVHWGLWDVSGGMSGELTATDVARLGTAGIRPMAAADGLALLDHALRLDAAAVLAGALDVRIAEGRRAPQAARPAAAPPARPQVRDVPRLVLQSIAAVLGYATAGEIDPDRAFSDLGFDSLTAVDLRNRLSGELGVRLPGTIVFDHPSPAALIRFVTGVVDGATGDTPAKPPMPTAPAEDAIAIVGMACRFPGGVRTPQDLWELVASGTDAITSFPTDRGWDPDLYDPDPDRPGSSSTRYGGFLHDAAEFDAEFFGISPREALAVDPQQRLLLETAWEAVEDAGIDPATLRGTQSGVFVGVMYSDYGARVHQRRGAARDLEGYLVSGSAGSVASGRVSYALGLEGPAVTVDTACSSSLVAVHQAAQALRLGECTLALAGGATVMASPATFIEFSRQRGLAPDGRCKPFSADADGTAWGEGVGLLVLERLSDARRNGHRVLAVVRGSAINQDGASNGLTAPNGPAQERVIGAALRNAGLRPHEVDVLEAHGTGTRLGDPIEAGAVLNTYGGDRAGRAPLVMGSVKSNIGHTQAAAGVAGIIKMVLAMRHGRVPATLHLGRPTEHVDWSGGTVTVAAEPVDWPATPGPRRAAVSSFGISGTNAHVIVESGDPVAPPERAGASPGDPVTPSESAGAPQGEAVTPSESAGAPQGEAVTPAEPVGAPPGVPVPWVLTARTSAALRERAVRLKAHVLAGPAPRLGDVALSLATTRTPFERRAVVLGRDLDEMLAGLDHLIDGTTPQEGTFPVLVTGTAARGATAVLFTGQGSQHTGMGTTLYRTFPAYARAFDDICERFRRLDGTDVAAVITGDGEPGLLDQTMYTQAALFTLEVALFRLLESWGLPAGFLAGHSIGEIAAAHVAGALTQADAVALVATRGRLMQQLPGGGLMAAVGAGRETVERLIEETGSDVDIAAVNAPGSVVISGAAAAVEKLAAVLAERGHRTKTLTVSHAFHSSHMEPMLAAFRAEIDGLRAGQADRTVVSTLTAREAGPDTLGSAEHWAGQVRGTVRFADAVARLRELGATRFLEAGPDAVLTAMVEQCDVGDDTVAIPVLDRRRDELLALWSFVARAFVSGVDWDWRAVLGYLGDAVTVPLPTYPFRRERLWLAPPADTGTAAGIGAEEPEHPLLTASVVVPDGGQTVHTGVLSPRRQPWLAEHALAGTPVLPAAALVELLTWLAGQHGMVAVAELTLHAPLLVPGDGDVHLRVTVADNGVRVHARPVGAGEWTLHAEAVLTDDAGGTDPWTGERPAEAVPVDVSGAYAAFAEKGYDYGPAFQGLRAMWRAGDDLYAEVDTGHDLVPGLLDATLHAWIAGRTDEARDTVHVPYGWRDVRAHGRPQGTSRVRIRHTGEETFGLDVTDVQGVPVLSAAEVRVRPVPRAALHRGRAAAAVPYELVWTAARVTAGGDGDTTVLAPAGKEAGLPFPVVTYTGDGEPGAAVRAALRTARDLIVTLPEHRHLVVVTRGAVAVDGDDRLPGLAQASLWGLVRTAQQEFPGRVSVVDVDDHPDSAALLPRVIAARPGQLAVRRGEASRPRLRPLTGAPAAPPDLGAGTVLVSGAGGALGREVVRHLVARHGARDLLLVSRRGDGDPALRALTEEVGEHARVRVAACDLADPAAAETLLTGAEPPVTAVFHIAGTLDDAVLENTTPERLDRVLRPKVDAAWNLHRFTRDLRAFVLFSSLAGVLGNAGQAGYAAANAFLDALAQHRRAAGLPGVALAWGLWETGPGDGMAAELDVASRSRLGRMGIRPLTSEAGLDLLDTSLACGRPAVVPAWFDTGALARRRDDLPEVLADLVPARPAPVAVPLPRRLAGLDRDTARAAVHDTVAGRVAEVLGLPGAGHVPDDRGLFDLGLDSLTAIELRNRLGADLGERLPATVLFDHPTVGALTEQLLTRCAPERPMFDPAALEMWVSSATGLTEGDGRRAELARALRSALDTLETSGSGDGADPLSGLDSASDDELFGLLDRQLGE
ncbi:SDR family NAD(P)-dependent oxidoreductase [Sphaerisporangium sp. B11E5]|uniref:SDR family NAD(P)-dependent oxidoreductase n=1 Tax=Sphaerisporangium sp. B11E5 TaxID=3153563 RepID=UPI00325D7C0D